MSTLTADPSITATVDYRRRARRIRASFDRAPLLRHQALKDLARERNLQLLLNTQAGSEVRRSAGSVVTQARKPALRRTSEPAWVSNRSDETIEADFIQQVAAKLQAFGFTFSDRIKLLDLAERSGINRFRANVILAMHEHQAGRSAAVDAASKPFVPSLMAVLVIEAVVVSILVWICTL